MQHRHNFVGDGADGTLDVVGASEGGHGLLRQSNLARRGPQKNQGARRKVRRVVVLVVLRLLGCL